MCLIVFSIGVPVSLKNNCGRLKGGRGVRIGDGGIVWIGFC